MNLYNHTAKYTASTLLAHHEVNGSSVLVWKGRAAIRFVGDENGDAHDAFFNSSWLCCLTYLHTEVGGSHL